MPKKEVLEFEGGVTEILPDARYRVQLDNGISSSPMPPDEKRIGSKPWPGIA